MTQFEYLAIAFGLLFSLAALRLIGGLPHALDRAKSYWIHAIFLLMALQTIANSFWVFWNMRDVDWTLGGFYLALSIPASLYFSVAMLVPGNPERIESWDTHYYAVRPRFFAGWIAFGIAAVTSAFVNRGVPPLHPARAPLFVIIALAVFGLISSDRRVHAGIAMLAVISMTFRLVTAM